jgi:hypothetical protein
MKQLQLSSDQPSWQWPLDLDTYDRSPVFSEDEYHELAHKMSDPHAQLQKRSWKSLLRLLQPIEDAFRVCFERNSQGEASTREAQMVRVMAIEMYRYKTPFWAWSLEQWLEVIGESAASFAQRYGWTGDPQGIVTRKRIPLLPYLLA